MKGEFEPLYSVWAIDAWADGDDEWLWNNKAKMFEFRTSAMDVKRSFLSRLRRHLENPRNRGIGIHGGSGLGRYWYYVKDEGSVIEVCRKYDGMPVYAAIRETP